MNTDPYAEARRIAEDAAVRELERAMAWAEHVAAALALVEGDHDRYGSGDSGWLP